MALHQALWLGLMAPDSNISFKWFLTSSTSGGWNLSKLFFKRGIVSHFYDMLCGMGTAQFCWIQREYVMVFVQELAGCIHQLRDPRIQATQVQFIEQFTMPLPHCQPKGMEIWGLIGPFLQSLRLGGVQALAMQLLPSPLEFSPKGSADRQYYSVPLQLPFYCLFLTQYMCSVWSGQEARCHPESARPIP